MTATLSRPRFAHPTYRPRCERPADVHGNVRLLIPRGEAIRRIIDGLSGAAQAVPIEISRETQAGTVTRRYDLRLTYLGGRLQTITLTYTADNGYLVTRTIDATFGVSLGSWACDCPDFRSRGVRRSVPHCCHSKATHALCRLLGAI